MDKIQLLDEKIEKIRFYKALGKVIYTVFTTVALILVLIAAVNIQMMQTDTLNTLARTQQEIDDLRTNICNMELLLQNEEKTVRNGNDELTGIYTQAYSDRLDKDLIRYTVDACSEWKVDPSLVFAVMETESGFNPIAKSDSSVGLMQINTNNAEWLKFDLGVTDLYDPYENILSGVYILSTLNYDTVEEKLMAYNMGSKGASKLWNKGIYATKYTDKVISRMI